MIESVVYGTLIGAIAGMIPGIGLTVTLLILFPILVQFDLLELLVFYVSMAGTVQYIGSVCAIYFGVPGEVNSLPAVKEGYRMSQKGLGQLAISSTAIGSLIGSLFAIGLTFAFSDYLIMFIEKLFSVKIKIILLSLVLVSFLFFYNKKNKIMNLFLMALGFALSLPGEHHYALKPIFTFGIPDLEIGVPLFPVMIGLFVLPNLFSKKYDSKPLISKSFFKLINHIKYVKKYIWSVVRGSVIGYFTGFVPALTTTLATYASHTTESKLHPHSPLRKIAGAETANNSAQFTSLIPLLILGIPITGSEALIYNLAYMKGFDSVLNNSGNALTVEYFFKIIVPYYALANILAFALAWPLSKQLSKVMSLPQKYFKQCILALLIVIALYIGYQEFRMMAYAVYLIVFCAIGYMLRKLNTLPLVFTFLLGKEIDNTVYLFYNTVLS